MRTGTFSRDDRASARGFGESRDARQKCRAGAWLCIFLAVAAASAFSARPVIASQFVRLDYNIVAVGRFRHTMFLELFDDRPLNVANFLAYVNADRYDGTFMHRLALSNSLSPVVIQGGGYYTKLDPEPNL